MNRKADEYCYNLMEEAIVAGAKGAGVSKDSCVVLMNIMRGVRGYEAYCMGCREGLAHKGEATEGGAEEAQTYYSCSCS